MGVAGNVVTCDKCGRQWSIPLDVDDGKNGSRDEQVREIAETLGWTFVGSDARCPYEQSTV
jgi:hypothetical protein